MKKTRSLSILVVISLLGILTAGEHIVGLNFFIGTAYAKARTCADFGRAKSCDECNKDQSCEQIFEKDGPNKVTCYQCRNKRRCSDMKLLTQAECDSCASDPAMICVPHGKDEFLQKCFECRKKLGAEIDCAYYVMPAQCPDCKEHQICQAVDKSDVKHKLTCYQCRDKRRCEDMGLMNQSTCAPCMDDRTMICAPSGRDDFSQDCFKCRKKTGKEIDCKYYGLPSQCPPCLKDEVCEAVKTMPDGRSLTCYKCRKGTTCKDSGFFLKAGCAACMDDPTKICASRGNDDFGQACYECREKQGKEIDCRYYGLAQTCEKCTADEVCESEIRDAGDAKITCRWCRPKRNCSIMELLSKEDCPASCETKPGMICVAQGKDEFQNTCYGCVKKETCEDLGFLDQKGCENCVKQDPVHLMCEERSAATGEGTCYECVKKHGKFIDCAFFGLPAKPSGCGEGVLFKAVTKESEGFKITCYECTAIRRCNDLGLLNDCRSCMDDPSYICAPKGVSDTGIPCFECRKKEGSERDCAFLGLRDSCGPCPERQRCVPVTKDVGDNKKITCYQCKKGDSCLVHGLINAEDCAACIEDPNMLCAPKGKDDFGVDCFDCREKTLAEKCFYFNPNAFEDCSKCKENEKCVDAGIEGLRCYICKAQKRVIIEITWVIIIIERPHVRIVLKSSGPADSFQPSSVMALMKVDPAKFEEIKQSTEGMKGVSFFSSLQDLAQALQGLSKQKSFNQDSFKGFEEAPLPQIPPSTGENGSSPSFGLDEKKEAVVNGPVVACGKVDGKDALAIFDASGAHIRTITKEELTNPDILSEALQKAEEANQKIMQFRNLDSGQRLSELAKKTTSMRAEEITSPRAVDEKEENPTSLDPNDPLYYDEAGQSKSKVQEQMKEVTESVLNSGIGNLGGSAAVEKKKGPDVEDQWGIRKIGYLPKSDSNSAWNIIDGSQKNVVVAVIDSGFDMTHPDGPQYIWTNAGETPDNGQDDDNNGFIDDVHGWNFLNDTNDLSDDKGHGTFVAGIIAAKTNNGIGIAGINPGAVILPLKAADAEGQANSLNIFRAIHYAVDHGARVINISLGGRGVSALEQTAVNYARSKNVFVAIAAGNVNEDIGGHGPASSLGAFAVGALDFNGKKSTISNWGANNGLIAPGEEIYSLRSKELLAPRNVSKGKKFYYKQSGTSFSSPMVAATASLLLAKNPDLTAEQIEDILQASSDDLYDKDWDGESGAGLLNATKALQQTPNGLLTVKITMLRVHRDKNNKLESVDIFATVRGPVSEFTLEAGKGKNPGGFKPLAGPFTQPADNSWIATIDKKSFLGSGEWVIKISAKDTSGNVHPAQAVLMTEQPKLHKSDYE